MSYILEALKQSQRQRQNQSQNQNQAQETSTSNSAATVTTSDDMDERAVRKANALWLLVACAAIAAMVIGLRLAINQSAQPQVIQQPTSQPRQPTASSSTATSMVQPSGSEHDTTKSAAPKPSQEPSVVNEASSKAPQTTASRQSIPKAVLARVPDLNITGHIFSTQASMRRVTINGQNWVAGEWLGDDVQLHSITATGITLELEGRWRLDVSRSRGWQARK